MATTRLPNIVRNTLLNCICCVPKIFTIEEAEKAVNEINPTGIDSQWKYDTSIIDQCVQCQETDGNMHIVFVC